jgi:hypothetical protein
MGTGLLDEPALDDLAERLFWPDRPVFEHPARWLEPSLGTEILIDLDRGASDRASRFAFESPTWPRFAVAATSHRLFAGGQPLVSSCDSRPGSTR